MNVMNFVFNTITPKFTKFFAPDIAARPMTRVLKKMDKQDLVGVEIGVCLGENAYNILCVLSIKHLYLVDPYTSYVDNNRVYNHSSVEERAKVLLKPFNDRITFIKNFSSAAVDIVPDDLDFVYIDGNHEFEHVIEDCRLYFPKVKTGGILGGHDFSCRFMGVPLGVFQYAKENGLIVNGNLEDWWIKK